MTCICHSCKNYQSVSASNAPIQIVSQSPVADLGKPRRMKANHDTVNTRHTAEHDENVECLYLAVPCQPIDAAPQYNSLPDAKMPEPQRPDPGEGWRLLEPDEVIKEGDEFLLSGGGWSASVSVGCTPKDFVSLFYRRRVEPVAQDCEWTEECEGAYWDTSCGNTFCLTAGTPEDNKMKFCPYCGNRLALREEGK